MTRKREIKINKTIDEELVRQQIKLSRTLFEINPGTAKKVIAVANLEIERLQELQKTADEYFAIAVKFMEETNFDLAVMKFGWVRDIRNDIGDKSGAILARAFGFESASRMFLKYDRFSFAIEQAKTALESFKKINDQEGIVRIKALMKEMGQKQKDKEKK